MEMKRGEGGRKTKKEREKNVDRSGTKRGEMKRMKRMKKMKRERREGRKNSGRISYLSQLPLHALEEQSAPLCKNDRWREREREREMKDSMDTKRYFEIE